MGKSIFGFFDLKNRGSLGVVGAIVVGESGESKDAFAASAALPQPSSQRVFARVELLGRSVLDRTVDSLKAAGLPSVSLITPDLITQDLITHEGRAHKRDGKVRSHDACDVWPDVTQETATMREQGVEALLIAVAGPYVEFHPGDMFQFQREQGVPIVRACDDSGDLPIWVVALQQLPDGVEVKSYLEAANPAAFPAGGYVNRLETAAEVRRLVCDSLTGQCRLRPAGFEVKPGIWIAPGAQVERSARVVAPAFLGSGATVADQCLITRGTNLEANSQVDYGTVVEDSSVLSNTYVGIGLDLSHSVVDGIELMNTRYGIKFNVSDPAILRRIQENRSRFGATRSSIGNVEVGAVPVSSQRTMRR